MALEQAGMLLTVLGEDDAGRPPKRAISVVDRPNQVPTSLAYTGCSTSELDNHNDTTVARFPSSHLTLL